MSFEFVATLLTTPCSAEQFINGFTNSIAKDGPAYKPHYSAG
ncbi:MAG: hypothetical protein AB7F40_00730 [Victivallaceae bacterium]